MYATKIRRVSLRITGPLLVLLVSLLTRDGWPAAPAAASHSNASATAIAGKAASRSVPPAGCSFFDPDKKRLAGEVSFGPASALTDTVWRKMAVTTIASTAQEFGSSSYDDPFMQRRRRVGSLGQFEYTGTIDSHIFRDILNAGIAPAPPTTDQEFIRRVSLDMTGRIPDPNRVVAFLNDTDPAKRAKLIDELLAKNEWVDKWQMYFGDLYKNSVTTILGTNRFPEGRNAFYDWIRFSLQINKPYDRMARELISAGSSDITVSQSSYTKGEINYLVGASQMNGVPQQDLWDQMAANTFQTFLGISHLNCILCHNGRAHLDSISLWGSTATRMEGWQAASFFSRTQITNTRSPDAPNQQYYSLQDNVRFRTDYTLNTTTGNRPARSGNTRVAPRYIFSGRSPVSGSDYRAFLATEITSDFQFARATVNYIWKEFFGRGIVNPVDQFDRARLDPDNPPAAPWTLQPSNARLLNALAQDFISSGYDLKALMRQIANSQAYQLSSRYYDTWNPLWEPLFARHMVRRLWAEEIHDSIVQSSNILPRYTVGRPPTQLGPFSFAMQLPEPSGTGNVTFLDAFLRGDRHEDLRNDDSTLLQAMSLMNDPFVTSRLATNGSSLLAGSMSLPDDQLINTLFLAVLSRYPTAGEMALARVNLRSGNRTQEAQNLLWLLYNKVDFIFNY